ncbi:hypothetical protein DL96DRAFT_1576280 [Flagelloscypha sp. PMI_526]|nr:hypothetical protein DL96DRAFT_1576280 [Flagelloscypha sp. PMI_526]
MSKLEIDPSALDIDDYNKNATVPPLCNSHETVADMANWNDSCQFQLLPTYERQSVRELAATQPYWSDYLKEEIAVAFTTSPEQRLECLRWCFATDLTIDGFSYYLYRQENPVSIIEQRSNDTGDGQTLRLTSQSTLSFTSTDLAQSDDSVWETIRSHMLPWLFTQKQMWCAISRERISLQTTHLVELGTVDQTRVQLYRAIGGWKIIIYPCETDVVDALEEYISFLDEWDKTPTNLAVDWLSVLRKAHPFLHEGRCYSVRYAHLEAFGMQILTLETSRGITFDTWSSWVGQSEVVLQWLKQVQGPVTSLGLPEFLSVAAKLRIRLGPDFLWQCRPKSIQSTWDSFDDASSILSLNPANDDHSSISVHDASALSDTLNTENSDFAAHSSPEPTGETVSNPVSSTLPSISKPPPRRWTKSLHSTVRRWMRGMSSLHVRTTSKP